MYRLFGPRKEEGKKEKTEKEKKKKREKDVGKERGDVER